MVSCNIPFKNVYVIISTILKTNCPNPKLMSFLKIFIYHRVSMPTKMSIYLSKNLTPFPNVVYVFLYIMKNVNPLKIYTFHNFDIILF